MTNVYVSRENEYIIIIIIIIIIIKENMCMFEEICILYICV